MASFRVLQLPKIHLRNMVINLTHIVPKEKNACVLLRLFLALGLREMIHVVLYTGNTEECRRQRPQQHISNK